MSCTAPEDPTECLVLCAHNPSATYVGLQAAWSLLWALAFTLSIVHQVDVVGLTPLQLVLVGTVLEATCFLGEIPTGVVADLRSWKWSVVISATSGPARGRAG